MTTAPASAAGPSGAGAPEPGRPEWRRRWSLAVPVIAGLGGLLVVASAFSADGNDLRPATTNLQTLVEARAGEVSTLRADIRELQAEIDQMAAGISGSELRDVRRDIARLRAPAGLTPVSGPGMVVTLDDSPAGTDPEGADPDLLVVHQGDIQAFVNALWQGGATAVTLMGQRLISTSGVKCVGNTVVLQGVPYSPPYRIEAVGDPGQLQAALDASQAVAYYRQYVARYDLGLEVEESAALRLPAFSGRPALVYADRL